MHANLALFAAVAAAASLAGLSAGAYPAFAEVVEIRLAEPFYDSGADRDVLFSFTGTTSGDSNQVSVFVELNENVIVSRNAQVTENTFQTSGIPVSNVFRSDGTYTVVAFTGDQKRENGTSTTVEFKDGLLFMPPDYELEIRAISDKTVTAGETLSFRVGATDDSIDGISYKFSGSVQPGAILDPDTGEFSWTPDAALQMGSRDSLVFRFTVVAERPPLDDRATFTVNVKRPASSAPDPVPTPAPAQPTPAPAPSAQPTPAPAPSAQPTPTTISRDVQSLGIPAPFVEPGVDPQTYVDRYDNEPSYKQWFDDNYPDYDSIYHAVGLPEVPASFVEPGVDPQTYVDRYNNEPSYKQWFDDNYPDYDSIYHAVGLSETGTGVEPAGETPASEEPSAEPEPEPEPEPLPPPVIAPGAVVPPGLVLQPGQEFGECGEGTELANGYCVVEGTEPPPPPKSTTPTDTSESQRKGGGCLIATAAYGSEMAPQVQMLREIRDGMLMKTGAGSSFVDGFNMIYYSFSPHVADYQRENPVFRDAIATLLTPMLYTLGIMEHAESGQDVIMYGMAAMLANFAIYVGMPAVSALYAARYCRRLGLLRKTRTTGGDAY